MLNCTPVGNWYTPTAVEAGITKRTVPAAEVKTGTSQLGYTQVTLLQKIEPNAKIVLKGAYYIQSHLLKSEGGGGHEH